MKRVEGNTMIPSHLATHCVVVNNQVNDFSTIDHHLSTKTSLQHLLMRKDVWTDKFNPFFASYLIYFHNLAMFTTGYSQTSS